MLNENLARVELAQNVGGVQAGFSSEGFSERAFEDGMDMSEVHAGKHAGNLEPIVVNTRYGEITFRNDQTVTMERPVLGFPDLTLFGMVPLPGYPDRNLVLLQSLEDANVSFPCMALDVVNTMIEKDDILAVYEQYGITEEDGVVLCILTVRQNEVTGATEITANLRAPVFVDTVRRQGWQVVMANQLYPIRQAV